MAKMSVFQDKKIWPNIKPINMTYNYFLRTNVFEHPSTNWRLVDYLLSECIYESFSGLSFTR